MLAQWLRVKLSREIKVMESDFRMRRYGFVPPRNPISKVNGRPVFTDSLRLSIFDQSVISKNEISLEVSNQ